MCILRQSIYLLKYINISGDNQRIDEKRIWLDRRLISKITGISFPTYQLYFDEALLNIKSGYVCFSEELETLDSSQFLLKTTINSNWFKQFLNLSLDNLYPLDRFTILIAIWIVGVKSGHQALEQLMSDLTDQIIHEEANSCDREELLQLSQLGSFWLSYHKRYKATTKQADLFSQNVYDEADQSSYIDSIVSSSSESVYLAHTNSDAKQDESDNSTQLVDLRRKLRKVIDNELLNGIDCLVCGHQPSKLLEPLSTNSCLSCHNGPVEHCSISYRPLDLFNIKSLMSFRANLSGLVVISANEWARKMIEPNLALKLSRFMQVSQEDQVAERIDISENFERLTVIRRSSQSDSSDEEKCTLSSDEDATAPNEKALIQDSYLNIIESYALSNHSKRLISSELSESLKMLKFVKPDCSMSLPLFSPDLLVMDSLENSIRISIVASNNLFASGSLWSCSARSLISQLLVGCGRMFTSVELVGLGQGALNEFSCPICKCQLNQVLSLCDFME